MPDQTTPGEQPGRLPEINRSIHEPARLAIMTVLSSCLSADFLFLQNITGLSKGNLSVQLTNLEAAGLIEIRKEIAGRKTRTTAELTARGRQALEDYWITLDQIRSVGLITASART